jgi:hypothetical protein
MKLQKEYLGKFGGTILKSSMLAMAQSGAMDSQLINDPGAAYSMNYTKSLLYLADSKYLGEIATKYSLQGAQWGVMNELGSLARPALVVDLYALLSDPTLEQDRHGHHCHPNSRASAAHRHVPAMDSGAPKSAAPTGRLPAHMGFLLPQIRAALKYLPEMLSRKFF